MVPSSNDPPWVWDRLDHSKAETLLSQHLPIGKNALEHFGSGDFCIAFKLGDQVVRVARHPEAAAALKRETCVLAKIADLLPLPVPRLTYHSLPDCPSFTIHKQITGEVLTREIWEQLPLDERHQAAAALADFLRALHSLPVEPGMECGIPRLDTVVVIRRLREIVTSTIDRFLDHETRRQLDDALKQWSVPSQSDGRKAALLHRDMGPGHVFYDPQTSKLTGVIDFADLAIGDPARDFIYIYENYGSVILEEVLQRYTTRDTSEMISAIRKWYILEAITWTVQKFVECRPVDMNHGLEEIKRELATWLREQ